MDNLSRKSDSSSHASQSSFILAQTRAKAEAAKARFLFASKEAKLRLEHQKVLHEQQLLLQKQQNDIELLNHERELAVAEAELSAIKEIQIDPSKISLPRSDPQEMTQKYVDEHCYDPGTFICEDNVTFRKKGKCDTQTNDMNQCSASELSKFLLKKDLIVQRLTLFTDEPSVYQSWKNSFRSVMNELQATPSEELDLLVKWLGRESGKYAVNLRAANSAHPERGLQRLWDRLEERYGTCEMVDMSIKTKLSNFGKISHKNYKELFDLSDILTEIESLKEDGRYNGILGYFDAPTGVNPIVQKLPFHLQTKWTEKASTYKRRHSVAFPPFSFFAAFIRDVSTTLNDPSFHLEVQNSTSQSTSKETGYRHKSFSSKKTEIETESSSPAIMFCPIHKLHHSISKCRIFKEMSIAERKDILYKNRRCFRCLDSDRHSSKECDVKVKCQVCDSTRHLDIMHDYNYGRTWQNDGAVPHPPQRFLLPHGGEQPQKVASKCSQVCGDNFAGKSCAKTILTKVYPRNNPEQYILTYAVVDDQSNKTLAKSELFEVMAANVTNKDVSYSLSSCSGMIETNGRELDNMVIEAIDGQAQLDLPTVIECEYIPDIRDEIATPAVVTHQPHLRHLVANIPPLDPEAKILLLIGRDLPEAHHVLEQVVGPKGTPFAQRLPLGWVVVGDVCLGQVHKPSQVNVMKTVVLPNGRPSVFTACENNFNVKIGDSDSLGSTVFERTKDDDKIGPSVQDKLFLQQMDKEFTKDDCGNWTAPLPFKPDRPILPNNRNQALKRAQMLDASLQKNPQKKEHFLEFMEDILERGHAEPAPEVSQDEECWYLPIFGVYHPKKSNQLRAVFDSSSTFHEISLNKVLMTGPDLANNLLGVLLRFRKAPVAITADIQRMFYCFYVKNEHRNYLRFFWYKDNNMENPLIEYRMCVHVFGNSPSPAVATYGLRKTVENCAEEYGMDVKNLVNRDFYVDDALTSVETVDEGISLLRRTQAVLQTEGHLRLHKIASNSKEVMAAFPQEDLAKDLKNLDISIDELPVQHSLGLSWDLNSDSFLFKIQDSQLQKPYTRRGLLSTINSIFDPLGFLAPITVQGKMLLRELSSDGYGWDEDLPSERKGEWISWKDSLQAVEKMMIPRTYMSDSLKESISCDLHIYSDASEKVIASVAYMKCVDKKGKVNFGFILGKAKVAPSHGNTVPRLELCAAVLSVELYQFISDQLDMNFNTVKFYTDSKVVLGYIRNETKRFYTYVSNRIEKIRRLSSPEQWGYVHTDSNPADAATRNKVNVEAKANIWLTGPNIVKNSTCDQSEFPLIDPSSDKEVRPVIVNKTQVVNNTDTLGSHRFSRFSCWRKLVKAVIMLKRKAKTLNHGTQVLPAPQDYADAEDFIMKVTQRETYSPEIDCIERGKPIPKESSISKLDPYLDSKGFLRVGGRIRNSDLKVEEINPLILPGKSHIAKLLVTHYHERTHHQGRHITEGALRSNGFWITGVKRLVSSILYQCVACRKLRRPAEVQKMADLPSDRLTPGPPFSSVGVDTFGPWTVVTRKTRGGQANSKRWGILFSCLTTRAVHIEVVEEMSSSSFINALRRFIALRGKVRLFRSDRGTNFIGAANELKINAVNVEDGPVKRFLDDSKCSWIFNSPHSSHMGGAWERMIGLTRRILDSTLSSVSCGKFSHEVLVTLMAEVCAILNARPITPVSTDPENPFVLSPSMLLTHKWDHVADFALTDFNLPDMYRAQWKMVQYLANNFWNRWRKEYLHLLQSRHKWNHKKPNLKCGDIVLLRDKLLKRNDWPMGRVIKTMPDDDGMVRKLQIQLLKNNKVHILTRPVSETVLLIG